MVARADTRTNFRLNSGSFSGSELFSTRLTCSSNLCQEKFGDVDERICEEEKPVVVEGGSRLWSSFLLLWLSVLLFLLLFKVLSRSN